MTNTWEWETLARAAPILVFLLTITVVAELADAAGVFQSAAALAARGGRGSVRWLWLLVVLLGSVTTVLLSLDTTAVLLTPVVLALAGQLGVAPWPFALATVWLANTASLLLPVSNLTNLLLVDKLGWSVARYAGRMWLPALVAVAVSVTVLAVLLRTALRGHYASGPDSPVGDRPLFRLAVTVCTAVGPLFVAGVPPWVVGTGGALVLAAAFALRRREALRWGLLPWRLVVITLGLFLVVGFRQQHGLSRLLGDLAGHQDSFGGLLRTAASGAIGANLVNNLPAYIALEPVAAASPDRLLSLLIGTNLGPLVTVWASLATLLWRERCRAGGLEIRAGGFALAGLVGVPLLLVSSTAALWVTR
jgi:arsenical pump membrane protein